MQTNHSGTEPTAVSTVYSAQGIARSAYQGGPSVGSRHIAAALNAADHALNTVGTSGVQCADSLATVEHRLHRCRDPATRLRPCPGTAVRGRLGLVTGSQAMLCKADGQCLATQPAGVLTNH